MNKKLEDLTLGELEQLKKEQLIRELSMAEKQKNEVTVGSPAIVPKVNMTKGTEDKFTSYFNKYTKGDYKGYAYTSADTGCDTDVSSWSPEDSYVNAIWHAVYAKSKLLGIVNVGFDVAAGEGNAVQLRTIGKFGSPVALSACECGSCSSVALDTYSITLLQYALGTILCGFELYDVGFSLYQKTVEALGFSYAAFFDSEIFDELETASAGHDVTLANTLSCDPSMVTDECCQDNSLFDLYNAVNEGVAQMQAVDYEPDYIIMNPIIASILKRMQAPAVQPWANSIISIDGDGKLSRFGGLKVIEYSGAESDCTARTPLAIIIDSSRAIGAAFGKRPFILTEKSASCNSEEVYLWCYFNAAELDVNAICHISNP